MRLASVTRPFRNRRAKLLVAVVVALALAAAAAGYFTASGNGSGSVQVGTAGSVTITPGTPSVALYPNGSADVALSISNSNPTAIHIPSLVLDTSQGMNGFAVNAGHAGCNLSSLRFTTQSNGGAGWAVPADTNNTPGTLPLDLANAISMDTTAASACQGATFTVYLGVGT